MVLDGKTQQGEGMHKNRPEQLIGMSRMIGVNPFFPYFVRVVPSISDYHVQKILETSQELGQTRTQKSFFKMLVLDSQKRAHKPSSWSHWLESSWLRAGEKLLGLSDALNSL